MSNATIYSNSHKPVIGFRAGLIFWLVATLFYFYQYIVRVVPCIIANDIRRQFDINADVFATFGFLYLIGYAIMQVPVGWAMDRFGVRRVVLFSIAMCTFGSFLSSFSDSLLLMQFSRFIEGVGSACGFTSALKIVSDYFEEGKRGTLFGATVSIGVLGALVASNIIAPLMDSYHPKDIWSIVSLIGIVVFAINLFFLKPTKLRYLNSDENLVNRPHNTNSLRLIFNQRVILASIIAVGLYIPIAVLGDLWGVSFLQAKLGVTKVHAAQINTLIYVGMVFGSIIIPSFFERIGKISLGISISILCITTLFALLVYWDFEGASYLFYIAMFLLGFFCGGEMLCFTLALTGSNSNTSGTISGIVNVLNMGGSGVLQQLIGISLDIVWSGDLNSYGGRDYSKHDFGLALSSMLFIMIACCVCSFFIKKCKS